MQNYEQPVGKQWGWYSSASGIWQTVFVEPRAPQFVERFEITTDIDRALVNFRIFCNGRSTVSIGATSPAGEQFNTIVPVKTGVSEGELNVGNPMLWDTILPQLYSVQFQLHGDHSDDVVHGYFGMRSLSAETVEGSTAAWNLMPERRSDLHARCTLSVLLSGRDLHRRRYTDPARRHRVRESALVSYCCECISKSMIQCCSTTLILSAFC